MSLTRVKFIPGKQAITLQLAFFYGLCSMALITLLSLFLYALLVNFFHHADDQFVTDETRILQTLLLKSDHFTALSQEVNEVPTALHSSVYHYYIRVLDARQKLLAQTPGMSALLVQHPFFGSAPLSFTGKETTWWQSADGRHYFLMKKALQSPDHKTAWTIQIALDATHQKAMIKQYRQIFYLIVAGGALLSFGIGYLISRKGMRYLHDLTRMTEKITAQDLQQRIHSELWPYELQKLAKAYNQMLDRIQLAITNLSRFSDDLAHELRTPINNLMGIAEIALSHPTSQDDYEQTIRSMLEELHRVYQVIENLLFLARAENPKLDLQKQPITVQDEIRHLCQIYQALADEKNIQLTHDGEATLWVNQVMFRRMAANLLSNAMHYTPDKGCVHIAIKPCDDQGVQIRFIDNGIGIDEAHQPHLFQRFYRTDWARTQHAGGSGLGLSIVKSIVDLHQGTISVTSRLNQGTTIQVHFPA